VLWYLNPDLQFNEFKILAEYITCKQNGFTTFSISDKILNKILQDVYMSDLEEPPKNRIRKIIFDPTCGLTSEDKLKIVGRLIGRKTLVNNESIYQCMLDINDSNEKITIAKLAKILNCSSRTIHRNMSEDLKKEKDLLNIENEKI
jgi:predicted HTH transcriptional regulator